MLGQATLVGVVKIKIEFLPGLNGFINQVSRQSKEGCQRNYIVREGFKDIFSAASEQNNADGMKRKIRKTDLTQ